MRARHVLFAAPIAFVLAAITPSTIYAQEQQIPKELALALIQIGGSDGGEIIVGQMPPDLAATFTLPPRGRILGSFATLSFVQVVMTVPGSPDSASEFARRSLTEHGWLPRPQAPTRVGGLQYGPRSALPTTYCKAGAPDIINVATQFHGAETLVRITRSMNSVQCEQWLQGTASGSATATFSTSTGVVSSGSVVGSVPNMPLASIPPLWAPTDFRASQVCRQNSNGNTQTQSQPLRTELSLPEILAHYGRQLDSAGWKSTSARGESASETWANAATGQEVTITVTKTPSMTGCYELSLRATPRRSPR